MVITSKQCLNILTHARSLIATPDRWTRDVFARTASGQVCINPGHAAAVQFCIRGAIHNTMLRYGIVDSWNRYIDNDICLFMAEANSFEFYNNPMASVANFNNNPKTTHEDILKFFDKAIEALTPKSEESEIEKDLELV